MVIFAIVGRICRKPGVDSGGLWWNNTYDNQKFWWVFI